MAPGDDRRLPAAMLAVALAAFLSAIAGIDARATYGARVTADEPQYLITAISIGEDASLDVSDELAEERFLPFHEIQLNPQTIELNDEGRRVSPHDPLLPLLLAVPMLLGGWVGAKLALAVCAAAVAVLTLRLAVDRLGAPLGPATAVVAGFAMAPPLSVYGVQVYPAMPAALCVLAGALAVTAPTAPNGGGSGAARTGVDRATVVTVIAVVALPWLSVKYVPLAAVLALAGLWRSWAADRRLPVGTLAAYGVAGVSYLAIHRWLYGGWTVYAAGDHFVNGEFLVVGYAPNYPGRSRRLIGLLVDRNFGLIAWNPAFLALPPALVWLARSARPGRHVLLAAFAVSWITATWIAFTMHGWWWPGRQVVPVLPLVVAAIAGAIGHHRRALTGVLVGCGLGIASWLLLAWEASTDRRTLIVDFADTPNPWYQLWRRVLPDHQRIATADVVLTVVWVVLVLAVVAVTARRLRSTAPAAPPDPSSEPLVGAGDVSP
ncbi:MAG: hypothetical protein AAGA93_08925 [Actinomycetota bacterium]